MRRMAGALRLGWALGVVAALAACDDAPAPGPATDMMVEADGAQDMAPDAQPDQAVDAAPDLARDAEPDLAPDASEGCQADGECLDNQYCDEGVCQLGCRLDPDNCAEGQVCTPNHRCEQACVADEECETGLPGVCGVGRTACAMATGPATCDPVVLPGGDEACDGQDDDCDGSVDEAFPDVGQPCDVGAGVCAGQGTWACAEDGTVACQAEPRDPVAEACNGLDDDCDGVTDETFGDLGDPCEAGVGLCRREGAQVCRDTGEGTRCSAQPGEPLDEQCNGVDDDCDGVVDEAEGGGALTEGCYDGEPDTNGVGACAGGTRTCVEGAWGACEGQVLPSPEQCDGVDNDCNRLVDDQAGLLLTQACYDGFPGTQDVGPCRGGSQTCVGGVWGPCRGQRLPFAELCDQEDNDCNGINDDVEGGCECIVGAERACYGGPEGTEGTGPCRGGLQACVEPGVWGPCDGQVVPQPEVCNRRDDDCNGEDDDNVPGAGEPCTLGQGLCARDGVTECAILGGLRCDAEFVPPRAERCNGQDDDCDGSSDEAFPVGQACTNGVGACGRQGQTLCTPEEQILCDAEPGDGAVETCNRVDDDCDGRTDEDFDVGFACSVGEGVCRVQGVRVCDGPGASLCDAIPGEPRRELCNGLDDDCDGEADEDFGRGERCEVGQGICARAGVVRCTEQGIAACSAVPGEPGEELCNGFDDDCDGRTDEDIPAVQPCLSVVPGVCRPGLQTCIAGNRICVPNLEPSAETCNGEDDDCDGTIDEAPLVVCGQGVCRREIQACTDGADSECDPFLGRQPGELCNGLDDDCDGIVDEDAQGDGEPCGNGVGGCERLSVGVCADGALQCDAVPGEPGPEACNGVDDDCDGATDEDSVAPGGACTVGVGGCARPGEPACLEGALGCAGEAGAPADEVCNGTDDDCDGTTDEGFGEQVCGVGVCRRILANCAGGELPACDPLQGAGAEVCNGLDDDCDGATDEDTPGTGEACVGGLGVCRGDGLTACIEGRLGCAVPDISQPETCNGLDDDCDGETDEAPEDAGDGCTAGLGICARVGERICVDGALRCDAEPGEAAIEACNGSDDDCDGNVDENLGTIQCGTGFCLRDLPSCVDGEPPLCAPNQGAIAEQCNGVDEDCDGVVDEDSPQVGTNCLIGQGACLAVGQRDCVDGALVCVADQAQPQAETCNDRDDDCDGAIDEGFGAGSLCQTGVGQCRVLGRVVCRGDGTATCRGDVPDGEAEACDGLDNDCDGRTDEGLADLGPCDTGAVGVCGVGVRACVNAQEQCVAGVGPAEDVCDGLDNDCDGGTDEGLGSGPCGVGACARDLPSCVDGELTECDPLAGAQPEICNGEDDDCDGVTDEDAGEVGQPCDVGQGACGRVGTFLCEGGVPTCDVAPGEPQLERCNLVDDDCDGQVDENPIETASQCSAGAGVCRREAFVVCEAGQARCPAEAGEPAGPEGCNGQDDDCDGTTDEGFGQQLCGVGRCQREIANCDGGEPPACDPRAGAIPESCNGEDDDCDGQVDEDVPGVNEPCGEGLGECRRDGLTQCVGGALRCDAAPGAPSAETCDGRDNDCDGSTDEQPADAQGQCSAGLGLCARNGFLSCEFGRVVCDAVPGDPGAEVCNRLDDDCDGAADEALGVVSCGLGVCRREVAACENGNQPACDPLAGAGAEACNGADDDCDGQIDEDLGTLECGRGVCAKSVPRCQAGVIAECDPFEGAGPEVCDGLDNDCDDTVDELPLGDREPCADGVGQCQALGTQFCIAGALVCDAEPGRPAVEVCDGRDNDCDGTTDEQPTDIGDPCFQGIGACVREDVSACVDGFLVCAAVPGQPTVEVCNEIDDDCDNRVDEDGPDCNINGFGDACDIASQRSTDCNGNGVPDECDIAAGRSQDCNNDVLPDECFPERGCDFDITPPTIELTTVVLAVVAGGTLEVRLTAEDNLNLAGVGLLRDGAPIPLSPLNIAQVPFPNPGRSTLRGFAVDAAGNQATFELQIRVMRPLGDAVPRPSREPGTFGMCDPESLCPVARVTRPVIEVAPGGAVTLDAAPSTGAVGYRWAVRTSPAPAGLAEAFPGDPGAGGPADDPATPTVQLAVPEPGRYVVDLTVEGVDGQLSPSDACPSAGSVVVIARAEAPVRAAGGGCDPTGSRDRCEDGLVCRPAIEDDGVGQCLVQWGTYGEQEPDAGPDDLTTLLEGPDLQAIGRLDPCGGDFRDLYGLILDRAGLYTVEVTDIDGNCAGDAALTWLDTQVLEERGLASALIQPLERDQDDGVGRCPAIDLDQGNPGLYVFMVEAARPDFAFDYAVRVYERIPAGFPCDPLGIDNRCRAPAQCLDPEGDGEGTCGVAP